MGKVRGGLGSSFQPCSLFTFLWGKVFSSPVGLWLCNILEEVGHSVDLKALTLVSLHGSCTKCGFRPGNVGTRSWLYFLMAFPSVHRSPHWTGSAVQRWSGVEAPGAAGCSRECELASLRACVLFFALKTSPHRMSGEVPLFVSRLVCRGRGDGNLLHLGPHQGKLEFDFLQNVE